MKLLEIIREVQRHLEESGRLSYRMLRREFGLDDEALEELIEELVDIRRVAVREDKALAWSGTPAGGRGSRPSIRRQEKAATRDDRGDIPITPSSGPSAGPRIEGRSPLGYTPKHFADKTLQSKSALEACPEPSQRGERKQVTVLFPDVKGSMELAEQHTLAQGARARPISRR